MSQSDTSPTATLEERKTGLGTSPGVVRLVPRRAGSISLLYGANTTKTNYLCNLKKMPHITNGLKSCSPQVVNSRRLLVNIPGTWQHSVSSDEYIDVCLYEYDRTRGGRQQQAQSLQQRNTRSCILRNTAVPSTAGEVVQTLKFLFQYSFIRRRQYQLSPVSLYFAFFIHFR